MKIYQAFVSDNHFNLKLNGLTSTTWTWDGISEHHPNGLLFFNWIVMPDKSALELDEQGKPNGNVAHLK